MHIVLHADMSHLLQCTIESFICPCYKCLHCAIDAVLVTSTVMPYSVTCRLPTFFNFQ